MSWIQINNREDLPKTQCECWVIDRCERITHETYYFGLGGFITSLTMSLRDQSRRLTHYWVIDKPMSPKQCLLKEARDKIIRRNATNTLWTQNQSLRDLIYWRDQKERDVRYAIEDGYHLCKKGSMRDSYELRLLHLRQVEKWVQEKRLEEFSYVHERINLRSEL